MSAVHCIFCRSAENWVLYILGLIFVVFTIIFIGFNKLALTKVIAGIWEHSHASTIEQETQAVRQVVIAPDNSSSPNRGEPGSRFVNYDEYLYWTFVVFKKLLLFFLSNKFCLPVGLFTACIIIWLLMFFAQSVIWRMSTTIKIKPINLSQTFSLNTAL